MDFIIIRNQWHEVLQFSFSKTIRNRSKFKKNVSKLNQVFLNDIKNCVYSNVLQKDVQVATFIFSYLFLSVPPFLILDNFLNYSWSNN